MTLAVACAAGIALTAPTTAVAARADGTAAVAVVGAPFCGIYWGSAAKTGTPPGSTEWFTIPSDDSHVDNVRAGRHDCYDRLVVDVHGSRPGFRVRYVDTVAEYSVISGERGPAIPLRGGAFLEIMVPTNAGHPDGSSAYEPMNRNQLVNVAGWNTFRQVAEVGYYEAQRQFGLGVRGRLPFRVFTLAGPSDHSRLVIDVAHRW